MAVRNFETASQDFIQVTAPTWFGGTGTTHTLAALVRRESVGAYQTIMGIRPPGTGRVYMNWLYMDTNRIELVWNETLSMHAHEAHNNWETTAWQLVFVTVDDTQTGDSNRDKFRFHNFDGTTWQHGGCDHVEGGFAGPADWTSEGTDVKLEFGRWSESFNWFDGEIAMAAIHKTDNLSDGEIEALAGGDVTDYVGAGFDHLWEFNQASTATPVTDLIGSLDQEDISGTTVVGGVDPSSAFYVMGADPGGGDPEPTAFVKWDGVLVPSVVQTKFDGVLYPGL